MDGLTGPLEGPAPGVKHLPLGITVKSSTLHRVAHVAAGVVLITSGLLVATHLSPEVGAGMIASGVHQIVTAMVGERSQESELDEFVHATGLPRHAVPSRRPAFALDL